MAYRYDDDLEFLESCKDEDLEILVNHLTKDKDGDARFTEELTMNENYKKYYPQHSKYWREIAAEIQCFGGNTFATMLRGGKGVVYKEVLCDVCDKLKVNYNKNSSCEMIESYLLQKVLIDSLDKMSPEERESLARELGMNNTSAITAQALTGSFQALFKLGGFKSYQILVIVANTISKALFGTGLKAATNAALTRVAIILAGPIGWIITGLWTAVDIAGPAYRITIPAVFAVATLRLKSKANEFNF